MAKPTRQSLLDFGVPPPVAAQPPLLVERVSASAGLLFYRAHGLALDAPISLRLVTDTTLGATPGALPGGLSEGVTYFARPATGDSFALATAVSPAPAIASFTDGGTGRFSFLWDPGASIDVAIDKAWTLVLAMCTAHGGEVDAPIVTDAAAALAVRLYCAAVAAGDPDKGASFDGLSALWPDTYKPLLEAYFRGVPVRGATDATPTIGEGSPRYVRLGSSLSSGPNFGTGSAEVV
jgi:hypothetical protein